MKSTCQRVRVGAVGCGVIGRIYFQDLLKFEVVDVVACSDLIPGPSGAMANTCPGVRVVTTDELLAVETWRPLAWRAQARSAPGWCASSPVVDTLSLKSTSRTGSLATGLAERFVRTLRDERACSLPFTSNPSG